MKQDINPMSDHKKKLNILPMEWDDRKEGEEILARVKAFHQTFHTELSHVIVGQKEAIELILIAMLCKGHVLLEGVPGLGKTLMFKTFSKAMDLDFQHVQFTPDLMPSDILGTEIIQDNLETKIREMKFLKGPIFAHFLLADEINRTSPKTQAALLQAMQDREVSVGRTTYTLESPFFVLATQNPVDQEGTYPLPEAQLDRFMFKVLIHYPKYNEELEIAKRFTQNHPMEVKKIIDCQEIEELQKMVRGMLISENVLRYAVDLVTATRPSKQNFYSYVNDVVEWGAGPRATLNLVLAAKAGALLNGRLCVSYEDIRKVTPSVLRHRIKLNFAAEAEGLKNEDIISRILASVPEQGKNS
jgi:MoxR-like ATPase